MTTVNNGCTNCCKKCQNCPNCYDLDVEKIRQYLHLLDDEIVKHNDSQICTESWGYGCRPVKSEDYTKLHIFKKYVKDYYEGLIYGYNSGICEEEVQTVLEQISKIIHLPKHSLSVYTNVIIDDSEYNNWLIENPYCVAWETWEKHFIKLSPKVELKVTHLKTCDIDFSLDIDLKQCDISHNAKIEYLLCKNNYKLLVENFGCKFDLKTYVNLVDCGLDYTVISKYIDCKVDSEIMVDLHKCDLNTDVQIDLLKCGVTAESIVKLVKCGNTLSYSPEANSPIINNITVDKIDVESFC